MTAVHSSDDPGVGTAGTRPFRFGYQLSGDHLEDPVAAARRAEELGFDIITVSDHVGSGPAPLPTLTAMAMGTEHIRLGTMVLNGDMRNPVQLAWETATLDRLSHGRFELGLGAGHTPQEYRATGIPLDPPAVRKARLLETVEIIRRLVDGETVNHRGQHHRLTEARIEPSQQEHLPILVGGNGRRLLTRAAALADIIGLQGLGRTRSDGHSHTVNWSTGHLDEQVATIAGAPATGRLPELGALVQVVDVTDDRTRALATVCDRVEGLPTEDAAQIPYLLTGSVPEIVEHLHRCRDRWGITYFTVRVLEEFAPVLASLVRRV